MNGKRMDCRVEKSRINYYEKGREKRKEKRTEEKRTGEERRISTIYQFFTFFTFLE